MYNDSFFALKSCTYIELIDTNFFTSFIGENISKITTSTLGFSFLGSLNLSKVDVKGVAAALEKHSAENIESKGIKAHFR
jgi:hypothetical protein